MVNLLLHGCNGRMGQTITLLAKEDEDLRILAGVDAFGESEADYLLFPDCNSVPEELTKDIDVVIDFSTAQAVDALLEFVEKRKLPCVLCTTGLSEAQISRMHHAAKHTAILKSANMSLGVNLLQKILKENAAVLTAAGFDVEVEERHHGKKLDAPSGTAIALADAVNESLKDAGIPPYAVVTDRYTRRAARPQEEIGISSVRGGTIVGDHDVLFAGNDEVVTLSHRAYSRAIFAKGALSAARFLEGKPAGLYDMQDVVTGA